jgi:AraC-like DNA-binding protein
MEVEAAPGVMVVVHECTKPRGDWSPPELLDFHGLVLVRRGAFRIRLDKTVDLMGPSMAFFEDPGKELQIQHPTDHGDTTTMFKFTEEAALRLTGDAEFPSHPVITEGWIDLVHRRLLKDIRTGIDPFEAEEGLARLVGILIESVAPGRFTATRSSTQIKHQRIVDLVREAVYADPANSNLPRLARLSGHSMFHVSRTFRRLTGVSIVAYRNSVRSALALERLEHGESDLAGLAFQLGFTDQAHMTRVIRSQIGVPPSHIRAILREPNGQAFTRHEG